MVLDAAAIRAFKDGIRNVSDLLFGTTITHISVSMDRNEWGEEDTEHLDDAVTETTLLCLREPVEMKEWLSLFGTEEIADWKLTFNREYLAENNIIIEGVDAGIGDILIKYQDRVILNDVDYEIVQIRPIADWVGSMTLIVLYLRTWRFTNVEE